METKVMIRSVYGEHKDVGFACEVLDPKTGELVPDVGLTKQADKDSCDINKILERFERTGELPSMIRNDARYGDFSSVPAFQEALEIVAVAEEQFAALDASVRARFNHDPAEMLAFAADPKNADEMVKLGLALPKEQKPSDGNAGGKPSDKPADAPAPKVPPTGA